jgi:hypothetical protein
MARLRQIRGKGFPGRQRNIASGFTIEERGCLQRRYEKKASETSSDFYAKLQHWLHSHIPPDEKCAASARQNHREPPDELNE